MAHAHGWSWEAVPSWGWEKGGGEVRVGKGGGEVRVGSGSVG